MVHLREVGWRFAPQLGAELGLRLRIKTLVRRARYRLLDVDLAMREDFLGMVTVLPLFLDHGVRILGTALWSIPSELPPFITSCVLMDMGGLFLAVVSGRCLDALESSELASAGKKNNSIANNGVARVSSEKRHLCDLVLLFMGSLHKYHFRVGVKEVPRGLPGTHKIACPKISKHHAM